MKKTWIWIIIAASLMIAGALIFGGTMLATNFEFSEKFETHEQQLNGDITDILINTKESDIKVLPSEDGKCRVVYVDKKLCHHSASISDGQLSIQLEDNRKWYNYISFFNFKSPSITVYLPAECIASLKIDASTADVYLAKDFTFKSIDVSLSTGDIVCNASSKSIVKIKTRTGSISLAHMSAESIDLKASTGGIYLYEAEASGDISAKVSTGETKLNSVKCKNLTSIGTTGEAKLRLVTAEGHMHIERDTGDIEFYSCDAGSVEFKTSTGDVKGSFGTDKIFNYKTSTGKVVKTQTLNVGKVVPGNKYSYKLDQTGVGWDDLDKTTGFSYRVAGGTVVN